MNVLALDLSLTSTGVCLTDGTTTTWKPKSVGMPRLADLEGRVYAALKLCVPDVVVLEGYAFGAQGRTHATGELGGVVRLGIWRRRIPMVDVPPKCLKKYATGNGNASKDQVLAEAVHRFGVPFQTNDEADARWLFEMATDHYGNGLTSIPAKNRTALDGVEWPTLKERAA